MPQLGVPQGDTNAHGVAPVDAALVAPTLLQRNRPGVALQYHVAVIVGMALILRCVGVVDEVVLHVPVLLEVPSGLAMLVARSRSYEGHDVPALEGDEAGVASGTLRRILLPADHRRIEEPGSSLDGHVASPTSLLTSAGDVQLSVGARDKDVAVVRNHARLRVVFEVHHHRGNEASAVDIQRLRHAPLAATPRVDGQNLVVARELQSAADLCRTRHGR
mmetsp:Transcript_94905/g.238032  ORF Transcript_94905/g.238032 Transcript_94905/m.238032 type:complete len:219 (-) Transcript_94905:2467-3123(-)